MAKNRPVNSDFWIDEFIESLTVKERYLFLYLLTNPDCHISGIYKTTVKRMATDTDLTKKEVEKALSRFSAKDKVYFKEGYIVIVNFLKYQKPNTLMIKGIEKALKALPNPLKGFIGSKESKIFLNIQRTSKAFESLLKAFERINKNIDIDKNENNNEDEDEDAEVSEIPDFYLRLADRFYQKKKTQTNVKIGYHQEKWAKVLHQLEYIDKYTQDIITKVLEFALNDDFWITNLISLAGIRKKSKNELSKFANILAKCEQRNNGKKQYENYESEAYKVI